MMRIGIPKTHQTHQRFMGHRGKSQSDSSNASVSLQRCSEKICQLKTLNNGRLSIDIPIDETHWLVDSPAVNIKDRIGKTAGPQFSDASQMTQLPNGVKRGQANKPYRAKHLALNGGLCGTPCTVTRDDGVNGHIFVMPHYHACKKVGGLIDDEVSGAASVAGANDGMHFHAKADEQSIENAFNTRTAIALMTAGSELMDNNAGTWA